MRPSVVLATTFTLSLLSSISVQAAETVGELLSESREAALKIFNDPQWDAVSNALGGARGVFIVPAIKKAGFIVGYEAGSGVLLARHGDQWSDPIFLKIQNQSVGFEAGVAESTMITLLMSDEDLGKFTDQDFGLGTSGRIALGDKGIGGGGSGDLSRGVTSLIAIEVEGAFAGGSFMNSSLNVLPDMQKEMYGDNARSVNDILASNGTESESEALRQVLTDTVQRAWTGGSAAAK